MNVFKGLRSLKIVLHHFRSSLPRIGCDWLRSLPKTIVELVFCFAEAEECWMRDGERKNADKFEPNPNRQPFDFAVHFPDLQVLDLYSLAERGYDMIARAMVDPRTRGKFEPEDLKALPSSLTSLSLHSNTLECPRATAAGISYDISHLPNLTKLELHCECVAAMKGISSIPSLHHLAVHPSLLSTDNTSFLIPKSLTKLKLEVSLVLRAEMVKAMPQSMKSFLLSSSISFPSEYLQFLPRGLTHLRLPIEGNSINQEAIHLPPLLTHLKLQKNHRRMGIGYWKHLPRGLKILFDSYSSGPPISPEEISLLPRGLTHLTIKSQRCREIGAEGLKCMPESLTRLSLEPDYFWQRDEPSSFLRFLPSSLTCFENGPGDSYYKADAWVVRFLDSQVFGISSNLNSSININTSDPKVEEGDASSSSSFSGSINKLSNQANPDQVWIKADDVIRIRENAILEWLVGRRGFDPNKGHFTTSVALSGNYEMLKWIYEWCDLDMTGGHYRVKNCVLAGAVAKSGDLPLLQWLHAHGARITEYDLPDLPFQYKPKTISTKISKWIPFLSSAVVGDNSDDDADSDPELFNRHIVYSSDSSNVSDDEEDYRDISIAHPAAENGHLQILQWAHSLHVRLTERDMHGLRPFSLASQNHHQHIVDWLKKIGIKK
jgi:hypothetical protein